VAIRAREPNRWGCYRRRALILVVFAGACDTGSSIPHHAVTRSDSQGVEVVLSRAAPPVPQWWLDSLPQVRVGDGSDEDDHLFRVTGALLLDDRIAIANAGSWQVRFYSLTGSFLGASGRRGRGPGEFQYVSGIWEYPGDSLLVYDFRSQRYSMLDAAGAFGRAFPMTGPDEQSRYVTLAGVTASGELIMTTSTPITPSERPRVSRPTERIFLYSPKGMPGPMVTSFPGRERYGAPDGAVGPRSFGIQGIVRGGGSRVVVASSPHVELAVYAVDGSLARIIRKEHEPVRVTNRHIRDERQRLEREATRFAGFSEPVVRGQRALVEGMLFPETFPAVDEVIVAENGHLWVREYVVPGDSIASWFVFGSDGALLASCEIAASAVVYDATDNSVLLGRRDSLGVEHVELVHLRRP